MCLSVMIRITALISLLLYSSRADICSHCSCDRTSKTVTCNSPTLLIRTVSLLPWIEQIHLIDLNLPHSPHFLFHPNLRVLRINRCGLQTLSAHSLLSLPNLEVLNVADNHLDTVPSTLLRSLKRIRVVSFARNRIFNLSQFSLVLAENLVLEQLDLSGNPLALSTTTAFLPPSVQLFLSAANLAFIKSSAIVFHPSTTCPMDVSCRMLAIKPTEFSRLTAFDVSNNRLKIDVSALAALTNATHLDFSYTYLPPEFAFWLEEESKAKFLNLSHAELHINDDTWSWCGRELKMLDISGLRLKRLRLSKNCILNTVIARENLLENSWIEADSLESLHLDRNLFLDWPILPPGVTLDRLRSLTISSNMLTFLPPHALSEFPNLQHLDASRNQISDIDHLAFPTLGMQLVSIDLSFNQLSVLPHPVLPSLIYLDVSSNNLVAIDSALFAGLPQMQHLKLANNPQIFTRCGEKCWSDHLDELTGLLDLDLSNCNLSRILHLSHLQSLRTLLLRGNQIVTVSAVDLPPNLSTLDLGKNHLHFTQNFSHLRFLRDLRVDTNPLRCDCSLHDIKPYLLSQPQITDPQLYYCFSGSWQYPLLPYISSITACPNTSARFVSVSVSTFVLLIIVICLVLTSVVGYKRFAPLMSNTYKRLSTEIPARF